MRPTSQKQIISDYVKEIQYTLIEAKETIQRLQCELASTDVKLWDHTPLEIKRALDYCKAHNYDPKGEQDAKFSPPR